MRSAMVRRFFTFRVTTDNTRPPLIRLSGQRPSQRRHWETCASPGPLQSAACEQSGYSHPGLRSGQRRRRDTAASADRSAAHFVEACDDLWAWIKASGRREDCWEGPAVAAQSRYHKQRSIVDTGDRLAGTAAE